MTPLSQLFKKLFEHSKKNKYLLELAEIRDDSMVVYAYTADNHFHGKISISPEYIFVDNLDLRETNKYTEEEFFNLFPFISWQFVLSILTVVWIDDQ